MQEKEDSKAQAAVEKLLANYAENPDFVESVASVARSYRKKKEFDIAIRIHQFIADNRADDPQAIWSQFELFDIALIELKDNAQAEAAYKTLAEQFGDYDEIAKVMVEVARAYRRLKRYADSLRICRRVLANWPDFDSALAARQGILYSLIGLGDAEGADAEVAGLLADYAGDERMADVVRRLGDEFYKKKFYESALGLYEYVAGNYAESKEAITAQRNVVTSHINLNDEPAAQQALDELTLRFADDPRLSEELYEIGEHYRKRKKYPSARNVYQHVIDDWPGTANAMWAAQRCIIMDIDETEDPNNPPPEIPAEILRATDGLLDKYAQLPELARVMFNIGEEYYLRGLDDCLCRPAPNSDDKWPKAVAIWQKALDAPIPDDLYSARASFFTGICYTHMKDDEAAIGVLEHVLQTWPDFEYAWNAQSWIGDCYMRLKKAGKIAPAEAEAKAEQAYKAVLENYPDSPLEEYAYWRLSAMMYRQQRWDEAVMYYELFLSLEPNDARLPVIRFNLGKCYEKLGDTEMALATYRLVLTSHPKQKKPHDKATKRIAVLEGGVK